MGIRILPDLWLSVGITALILFVEVSQSSNRKPFTITILHTNDIHSRYLETNSYGLPCSEEELRQQKCYGGFSRIHYKVSQIRKTHPNVVYLSAGDYFQGTSWYRVYKWKLLPYYLNKFGHTAMALGNHEFEDGVEALAKFLKRINFPVICSNIDTKREPSLTGKIPKSIVVEYEKRKIGIIGYTKEDTPDLADVGNLIFQDEITTVSKEAERLNAEGVKIIFALGHSGYHLDIEIAKIPFVDVVIGGHSNTFLFSGKYQPDIEKPAGEYPTIITTNGRNVPVVQAYAFGKYLGYLNVTFDEAGEVTKWSGNPILLNSSIPQDPKMEARLQKEGKKFLARAKIIIGKSEIYLDGLEACRMIECALGDFLADAVVRKMNSWSLKHNGYKTKSRVLMGILTGGMIRASIPPNRSITLEDLITVHPFPDTMDIVEMTGSSLKEVFEFSIEAYDQTGIKHSGRFLQISGIRVTYDLRKPAGQRVATLDSLIACQNGTKMYQPIDDKLVYKIATSNYLTKGGDGLKIIRGKAVNIYQSGIKVFDALLEYVKHRNPITEVLGNRTRFLFDTKIPVWGGV